MAFELIISLVSKVDGPCLMTFWCLLPYTTRICEVKIPVPLQMHMENQKVLELISNCYEVSRSINSKP